MLKNMLTAFVLFALISCADENEGKPSVEPQPAGTADLTTTADPTAKRCFASLTTNDTVVLSFTVKDTIVNGDLLYQFNEKDRNKGTIKGVLHGDTLIADYSFMSEGVNSIRQVVFLKQGDEMIEGFGTVADDKGRMYYKDINTLTFDKSVILKSMTCDDLPPVK